MDEQMNQIIASGVATILDKFAEPLLKKMAAGAKKKWDEFRVDFDIVFKKYYENAYEKYSRVKTILYRTDPKNISEFFEIPTLKKADKEYILADSIDKVTDVSNFVLIQGTGGIGKSTLLKHLFISELKKRDLIPIFIELKEVNDANDSYEIEDFIFERLTNLGTKLDKDCLHYALQSGCFLFLMDGYDEVLTDKKNAFLKKLDAFCDRYAINHFILTSRPCSDFIELQRFTVLQTCPLSKKQAVSLIKKAEFDKEVKDRFAKELEEKLYEEHDSFASNPLLLNIMLLTYDNYAEIPEKLHLFYAQAFETLYSKHDATKVGYRRELRCKLPYDEFKKAFAYFCYITYRQGELEFTRDELLDALKKITVVQFDPELFIYDLVNAVCVLYKEGFSYRFSHRSFQEYFTAVFLKELPDESMKKIGVQMVEKDIEKAYSDEVFPMLFDMAETKFERNILLPVIEDFEAKHCGENMFDLYFTSLYGSIKFREPYDIPKVLGELIFVGEDFFIINFIDEFMHSAFERREFQKKDYACEHALIDFIIHNRKKYNVEDRIPTNEIINDAELYALVKKTWIGKKFKRMVSARETLTKKLAAHELDLENLFPE